MVTGTLGGLELQPFAVPFLETPLEQATDVTTLDGHLYTDFTAQRREFELNWSELTLDQYNELRGVYDSQFSTASYPLFSCDYYSLHNVACRMHLNTRDVRVNGCEVYDVKVRLIQQNPIINDSNVWLVNESGEPILVS